MTSLIEVILYHTRFPVIGYSISTQTLNKYSVVVVLVAIYLSTEKKCNKQSDVNSLYIKYLSEKIHKKQLQFKPFLLTMNIFLKAIHWQELESQ